MTAEELRRGIRWLLTAGLPPPEHRGFFPRRDGDELAPRLEPGSNYYSSEFQGQAYYHFHPLPKAVRRFPTADNDGETPASENAVRAWEDG